MVERPKYQLHVLIPKRELLSEYTISKRRLQDQR